MPDSHLQDATNKFSHVKPGDTAFKAEGLRDFFLYRDLGIADATGGKVIAQLVKANIAPKDGTGWHHHVADFHIVYMLKGWARFMYGTEETLVAAGDCVHQRPGVASEAGSNAFMLSFIRPLSSTSSTFTRTI